MGGTVLGLALTAVLAVPSLAAQTLTLRQVLERSAEQSYASRTAAAAVRTRQGEAGQTRRTFLPAARLDVGYVRTTDPLGAFGALLRRRDVTPQAFDPGSLNNPNAIGLLSTALVLEQPLINVDGWYARQGAARGVRATTANFRWLQAGAQADAVSAYFAAVLARAQVETLEEAVEAARAHQRQAESMHRNGLVTRSDVLLATVRASEVESQLIAARGALPIARMGLAMALGEPGDTTLALPSSLPSAERIARTAREDENERAVLRGDIEAAQLMESMAESDVRRAATQMLPRINAFGRLDWHSAEKMFGGDESWSVGVMVSWSPFSGGTEWAQRAAADGVRLGAAAQAEAAEAQGALELAQATTALEVALEQVRLLDTAVVQSREAHRIVRRRYDGGLATVIELFDAAAQETATRLRASRARFDAIVALTEKKRARGLNLVALTSLEEGN